MLFLFTPEQHTAPRLYSESVDVIIGLMLLFWDQALLLIADVRIEILGWSSLCFVVVSDESE